MGSGEAELGLGAEWWNPCGHPPRRQICSSSLSQQKDYISLLTLERLKQLVCYNPETGVFTWKIRRKHCAQAVGAQAGSLNSKGYRRITVDGREYKAHRLAWFYVWGEWPTLLDHINRDRSDNRLCNLRVATPSLNALNKTPAKLSTSGVRGVHFDHRGGRWVAYIGRNAATRAYLPSFQDAVAARKLLESKLCPVMPPT